MGWSDRVTYEPHLIVGKTPTSITQDEYEIRFEFSDGTSCLFHHIQDCCEIVMVEDVNGDWEDLIGHPLLVADERCNVDAPETHKENKWGDSETWTFYTFRSIGGSVDVRWFGISNGYYSERVDFELYGVKQ